MIPIGSTLSRQRNKNLNAVEKVSGTRESIGMMSKRLLTIGGPQEWEWVPDYGYTMIALRTPKFNALSFNWNDPPDIVPTETITYNKMTLGDPETKARKEVYVISGMSFEEAESRLKNFLMKQFVNMEDVIDNN